MSTPREPKRPKDYKVGLNLVINNNWITSCPQDLWRKAIKQQILLIRMERENRRILGLWGEEDNLKIYIPVCSPEDEEQCAERRQKLDYSSLTGPSSEQTQEQWEGEGVIHLKLVSWH